MWLLDVQNITRFLHCLMITQQVLAMCYLSGLLPLLLFCHYPPPQHFVWITFLLVVIEHLIKNNLREEAHSQEAVWTGGYQIARPAPSDSLPAVSMHLQNISQPSKTAPPFVYHVFKHMSQWETFSIQTVSVGFFTLKWSLGICSSRLTLCRLLSFLRPSTTVTAHYLKDFDFHRPPGLSVSAQLRKTTDLHQVS